MKRALFTDDDASFTLSRDSASLLCLSHSVDQVGDVSWV
jgi:hypothetical protein